MTSVAKYIRLVFDVEQISGSGIAPCRFRLSHPAIQSVSGIRPVAGEGSDFGDESVPRVELAIYIKKEFDVEPAFGVESVFGVEQVPGSEQVSVSEPVSGVEPVSGAESLSGVGAVAGYESSFGNGSAKR